MAGRLGLGRGIPGGARALATRPHDWIRGPSPSAVSGVESREAMPASVDGDSHCGLARMARIFLKNSEGKRREAPVSWQRVIRRDARSGLAGYAACVWCVLAVCVRCADRRWMRDDRGDGGWLAGIAAACGVRMAAQRKGQQGNHAGGCKTGLAACGTLGVGALLPRRSAAYL